MARPSLAVPALAALLVSALVAAPPAFAAPAAAPSLVPRSTVLPDVPQAALDAKLHGDVVVRARVSRLGLVDSARVVSGDPRLRAPALAAARWYLYAPRPAPAWTSATISIDGTADADPLPFDIRGMALQAERERNWPAALDAWTGVLNRCGTHPTIRNPWAIREHIAELVHRMKVVPEPHGEGHGDAVAARVEQQRTVERGAHAALVAKIEDAQRSLPWWDEPYQWNAASLIGCGRTQDAIRMLVVFRDLTRDPVSRKRAERALTGIAAGDSIAVSEMLKLEGPKYETEW